MIWLTDARGFESIEILEDTDQDEETGRPRIGQLVQV